MENVDFPSLDDLEWADRRETWIKRYFEEIGKVAGSTNSSGASRRFGDFEFGYRAVDAGVHECFVATDSSLPPISGVIRVRWDQEDPLDAAAAVLAHWRRIRENPI
jgi:hypothetical protein